MTTRGVVLPRSGVDLLGLLELPVSETEEGLAWPVTDAATLEVTPLAALARSWMTIVESCGLVVTVLDP